MRKLLTAAAAVILLAGCDASAVEQSAASMPSESAAPSAASASTPISAGEIVTFGRYQGQDIDWYVLDVSQKKALLLSVDALDSRPFNEGPAVWEDSSLRAWLNNDFYQEAFTPEEQSAIQLSQLDNGDDLNYGTKTGQNTEDSVFLLSASEAQKYLSSKQTVTAPTTYASKQGAYTNSDGNCAWWLRSPGMDDDGPAYYSSQGEIGSRAHKGSETIIGVRPAVFVNVDALR